MVREVVSISVGQCGIQLGSVVWRQYMQEHSIDNEGKVDKEKQRERVNKLNNDDNENNDIYDDTDDNYLTFFNETSMQTVPRALVVDLEETTINDIKTSPQQSLYNENFLLSHKEDAANNFARGHYTVGKEMMDVVVERVRNLVADCENIQGFIMTHSVGGGTGSGLGMLILEKLAVDYRKKSKIGFEIYPSPTISTCIVEPYNALLSSHWLLDHTEVSLVLDNEAIYSICKKKLGIPRPTYGHLNNVIAKVVSSMTAALRFDGELNVDLNEFQTNLVPFPRLHFMTTSIAPIHNAKKAQTATDSLNELCASTLAPDHMLVQLQDFDVQEDKYMAISMNFRGAVKSKVANQTVQWVKNDGNKLCFVDWCPTGFKIGLNDILPTSLDDDVMVIKDEGKSVVMIGNNVGIKRVFSDRICSKYDLMYQQRAYVHWYVGEGMEEGEFSEAREDLGFLEKDFLDVVGEQASDEEENSEEDPEF